MGVITPPGCTQRPRPAGRWWRNLRAAWRCRARGRSLEVGGRGGHGGPGCARSAALVCARTEAHTGTRTRALHAHLLACVRRRVAHAQLHACSICTHKHARMRTPMHTHAHAHNHPRAVFCPPGDSKPPRPHAREAPPLGCTRTLPAACTRMHARIHAWVRAATRSPRTRPPRPVHQTRHVSVGEEKRREETRRGGTGRPVGVARGCRASRVGMLTARPQAEPSRSGCGRCCATWMWPTKPSPAVTASRALPRTRIRTQPRPREENYSSQQALRHRGPAGAAPQSTLGAVVRAAILCPQRDGAARRGGGAPRTRVCARSRRRVRGAQPRARGLGVGSAATA